MSWWERAACSRSPFLSPDAWHKVEGGLPVEEGAEAALVCQFTCPVQAQCLAARTKDTNVVVGGGWYDSNGTFHPPLDGELELRQAAAYLGSTLEHFRRRKLESRKDGWRIYYDLDRIQRIDGIRRQVHGTLAERKLHYLHGDPRPCNLCARADVPELVTVD